MFLKVHCICIVQFCRRLTHDACVSGLVTAVDIWSCAGCVSPYCTHPGGRAAALQRSTVPRFQRGTAGTHLGFGQPCTEQRQVGLAGTHPRFPQATRSRGAVLSGQERQMLLRTSVRRAKGVPVALADRT